MPLGDIAAELVGGIVRVIGNIIVEIILEIVVRGPGYLICKAFKKEVHHDSGWTIIVGLVFWVVIVTIGFYIYSYFSEFQS